MSGSTHTRHSTSRDSNEVLLTPGKHRNGLQSPSTKDLFPDQQQNANQGNVIQPVKEHVIRMPEAKKSSLLKDIGLRKTLSVVGLTLSLTMYSLLQERIMTVPFGKGNNHFKYSLFLVLCNRIVACVSAFVGVVVTRGKLRPVAPLASYGAVSLANVVSSTCQYEALKYVSFPVQVLAKCMKLIPVMMWQGLIKNKMYTRREYVQAVGIAVGCGIFLFSGDIHSTVNEGRSQMGFVYLTGGALLLLYLVVDGFTSTWQDHLFSGYDMELGNQVLYTATTSVLMSCIGLVGSDSILPAIRFMKANPEAWAWVLGISVASTAVQFFVSLTIKTYGALVFAAVMTTRQWISILLSCLAFMHPLALGQWVGSIIVFGTMYTSVYKR